MTTPELLALIVERGPALSRAAGASGIASIEMTSDRVAIRFAPPYERASGEASVQNASTEPEPAADIDQLDPLDDPSTYEDGVVPGYERDPMPGEEVAP